YSIVHGQHILTSTQEVLDNIEQLQLQNRSQEIPVILEEALPSTPSVDDLAYLYAYKSSDYVSQDSLLKGKQFLDLSLDNAGKSKKGTSKAIAYRAKRSEERR